MKFENAIPIKLKRKYTDNKPSSGGKGSGGVGTGTAKPRGGDHYLHKQWMTTKTGQAQHGEEVKRQRALPKKPKVMK